MIKTYSNVETRMVANVRGGIGEVIQKFYLSANETERRFSALNLNEMLPGTTIPEHLHENEDEFYFILEGQGIGILNGKQFQVTPGNAFLCKAGSTHGILNNQIMGQALKFISVFFT